VYILGVKATAHRPAFQVVKSAIGPSESLRAYAYWGLPSEYLRGVSSRPNGHPQPLPRAALPGGGANPVVIVLRRWSPAGFDQVLQGHPERQVAPGVAVLIGPLPPTPLAAAPPPAANARPLSLLWVSGAVVLFLFVAGGGWALALLPPDPVLRVCIAPALGVAVVALAALAWDRVGLTFHGSNPLLVAALAAGLGWGLALVVRGRSSRSSDRRSGGTDGSGVQGS